MECAAPGKDESIELLRHIESHLHVADSLIRDLGTR